MSSLTRLPVEGNDFERHIARLANVAAAMFEAAGWHISIRLTPLDAVRLGATQAAGILACADALRDLLAQSAQGRQALRDLGFEPVLQHVEGE